MIMDVFVFAIAAAAHSFASFFDIIASIAIFISICGNLFPSCPNEREKNIIETIFENKHITTLKWWCWKRDEHEVDMYKCLNEKKNERKKDKMNDLYCR